MSLWDRFKKQEFNPDFPHDEKLEASNGLLSPKGLLYSCSFWGHDDLAEVLGFKSCWASEKAGFIHLSSYDDVWREPEVAPTQAQLDTIFNWSEKHGKKLPYWWEKYT